MTKRVLFVTTSNLATNPRLVKEVRTSASLGHKVTVFCFAFQNWSEKLNNQLLNELQSNVRFVILKGDRTNKMAWIVSTLVSKCSRWVLPFISENAYLLSVSSFKLSLLLFSALHWHKDEYDIVIAHNPGAFLPSYIFSRKQKILLGIDLEDYHPGETNDKRKARKLVRIMKKVLSCADVITAASPLILKQSMELCSSTTAKYGVVHNVFSLNQQPEFKIIEADPLKLIWFSQTVGLDRGVQDVVRAMYIISNFEIHLTIIGNCTIEVKEQLRGLLKNSHHTVQFKVPMSENKLIEECSNHHIGLGLEPGFSLNNSLALSNKLFTYLLAGNAVLVSETTAQRAFLQECPEIGRSYAIGNDVQLAEILLEWKESPGLLVKTKSNAYNFSKTRFNWEAECNQFLNLYDLHSDVCRHP